MNIDKRLAASAIILTWLMTLPAAALYQFAFPAELIGRQYTAQTRLSKDGSPFGESTTKFEKLLYQGKTFLVVTGRSSGTIQGKAFASRVVRYFLLADGRITSYSLQGETKSDSQPWTDYDIRFNWANLTALVKYNDYQKKEKISKTVPLQPQLVAITDLDLYLSSLPARGVREEKLKALLPNGQTFGFLLKLAAGPATVTSQGRSVAARRIELKPDLGLISNFIPNVNYWVKAESPYELVRYAGAISGPGSPDVIQEIWRTD